MLTIFALKIFALKIIVLANNCVAACREHQRAAHFPNNWNHPQYAAVDNQQKPALWEIQSLNQRNLKRYRGVKIGKESVFFRFPGELGICSQAGIKYFIYSK